MSIYNTKFDGFYCLNYFAIFSGICQVIWFSSSTNTTTLPQLNCGWIPGRWPLICQSCNFTELVQLKILFYLFLHYYYITAPTLPKNFTSPITITFPSPPQHFCLLSRSPRPPQWENVPPTRSATPEWNQPNQNHLCVPTNLKIFVGNAYYSVRTFQVCGNSHYSRCQKSCKNFM